MAQVEAREVIAQVWCGLLGVSEASADDDFFAIGGNSLSAIRLVDAVEERLGRPFPLDVLFQVGTFGAIVEAYAEAAVSPER